MLACAKRCAPGMESAQKGTRTAVAVLDPAVVHVDGLQHGPAQRARLGLAVFTGKDLAPEAMRGGIDHQGFPRQGARVDVPHHCEAPFAGCKTVASEDFDALAR